jgi:hypothetical protein
MLTLLHESPREYLCQSLCMNDLDYKRGLLLVIISILLGGAFSPTLTFFGDFGPTVLSRPPLT